MNHLNFAITSLVDAQTSLNLSANLLSQNNVSRHTFQNAAEKNSFREVIQSMLERAASSMQRWQQERQNKMDILNLSKRQLEDIGIQPYDIALLRAGVITTDDLIKPMNISERPRPLKTCKTERIQNSTVFSANQPVYRHTKSA